jgi:hypothetical protein
MVIVVVVKSHKMIGFSLWAMDVAAEETILTAVTALW